LIEYSANYLKKSVENILIEEKRLFIFGEGGVIPTSKTASFPHNKYRMVFYKYRF